MAVRVVPLSEMGIRGEALELVMWARDDRCPVEAFLTGLARKQPGEFRKVIALLKRTAEFGVPVNEEKFRVLGTHPGLCELKSHQVRLYCCRVGKGRVLVLLEGVLKKTNKADPDVLRRAADRMRALQEARGDNQR